jgi:hypothetical protein
MEYAAEDSLIGRRVRIKAAKLLGSARVLNGIKATVTGVHPLAHGWYTIELEDNSITTHRQWTIPSECIVPLRTNKSYFQKAPPVLA